MAVKKLKPTSAGSRGRRVLDYNEITSDKRVKSLSKSIKKTGGRNNVGRVSVRFRGGGNKKLYRVIDFKRDKRDIEGTVSAIQYDPNRTCFIALIVYKDGEKRYILSPNKLKVDDKIEAGEKADIQIGNALPLGKIPEGTTVHNIEMVEGKGGQLARSAGSYAVLQAKGDKYVNLKLPSGETRMVRRECYATIGQVGNQEKRNTQKGKAGATRWIGKRPHVRGAVMNACDHPHGGGEGRAPVGLTGPMTPWGKPTLGYKTRKKKKHSNKYIVRTRK